jgi:phage virion morphogenesis protein
MPITATVDEGTVRVGLGELRTAVADKGPLLRIAGDIMVTSIARTFRAEGSPDGSWPKLALSTLKKKGYTSGHKLLIMSGRLFRSISYSYTQDALNVGTNVPYAAVHQFGSTDRAGAGIGPQAKIAGREVNVAEHGSLRVKKFRQYGAEKRTGKDGRARTVHIRAQGPDNASRFRVGAHTRHQNIPPRPFLVFRPEDPQRIAEGFAAFLGGKMVRIGKVGAR